MSSITGICEGTLQVVRVEWMAKNKDGGGDGVGMALSLVSNSEIPDVMCLRGRTLNPNHRQCGQKPGYFSINPLNVSFEMTILMLGFSLNLNVHL